MQSNWGKADDLVGRGSDPDTGGIKGGDDIAADLVFHPPGAVHVGDEADGEFEPVIGQAIVDAGLEIDRLDLVASL